MISVIFGSFLYFTVFVNRDKSVKWNEFVLLFAHFFCSFFIIFVSFLNKSIEWIEFVSFNIFVLISSGRNKSYIWSVFVLLFFQWFNFVISFDKSIERIIFV